MAHNAVQNELGIDHKAIEALISERIEATVSTIFRQMNAELILPDGNQWDSLLTYAALRHCQQRGLHTRNPHAETLIYRLKTEDDVDYDQAPPWSARSIFAFSNWRSGAWNA